MTYSSSSIVLSVCLALLLVTCTCFGAKETASDDNQVDKRFGSSPNFADSDLGKDMVDWSARYSKRFTKPTGFGETEPTMIDWSAAYNKRFGSGPMLNGNSLGDDKSMVDWNTMFNKRFGPKGNLGEVDSPAMVDWSTMFNKRGFGGNRGFGNNEDVGMIDWSNKFAKRFGPKTNGFGQNEATMINWNSLFSKKSLGLGRALMRTGLGTAPTSLQNGRLQRWHALFNRGTRSFGTNSGIGSNHGLPYGLQKWNSFTNN